MLHCEVLSAPPRWCLAVQEVVRLWRHNLPQGHHLASDDITSRKRALEQCPFLVEHIRIKAWVLVLHQSICGLVDWQLHWVHHTRASVGTAGCELSAVCYFGSTDWSGTFAIFHAVVTFTCPAMCKADFVALCHFAVDLVHREGIFDSCHIVFGNLAH